MSHHKFSRGYNKTPRATSKGSGDSSPRQLSLGWVSMGLPFLLRLTAEVCNEHMEEGELASGLLIQWNTLLKPGVWATFYWLTPSKLCLKYAVVEWCLTQRPGESPRGGHTLISARCHDAPRSFDFLDEKGTEFKCRRLKTRRRTYLSTVSASAALSTFLAFVSILKYAGSDDSLLPGCY